MNRALLTVTAALVLCITLFCGSYFAAHRLRSLPTLVATDDLDWLRMEFRLSQAEMDRIRSLHEGYQPKCVEMCAKIAAKKRELEQTLTGATNLSSAATIQLNELAALRAQCQANMLQHFVEVSQAMPPEQGRRYFAEMRRLTLGFHEQIEASMSDHSGHVHGND